MNNLWTQLESKKRPKKRNCDFCWIWKKTCVVQSTKLAATLGLRPFGLSSATIRDEQGLNTENNNVNDSTDNTVEREIEESKRFFSRFPPVAHHNMVQYSHLGKLHIPYSISSCIQKSSLTTTMHLLYFCYIKCHCTLLIINSSERTNLELFNFIESNSNRTFQ